MAPSSRSVSRAPIFRNILVLFGVAFVGVFATPTAALLPEEPRVDGRALLSSVRRFGDAPKLPDVPFDVLKMLVSLPVEVRRALLREFGEDMVKEGKANCNIFAGKDSCMALSEDSPYHKTCPNHPLLVDCAFYQDAMKEIDDDPTRDIRSEAYDQHVEECVGCENNLKELYCAEAVPPCGTFETHVENTFVPLLRAVVDAEQSGGDAAAVQAAAAAVVPKLAKATSLVAPCRRYCEAITASCGCGQKPTFGTIVDRLEAAREAYLPALPQGALNALLSSIRDTPLCDMYSDEHEEGFIGHCPDPAALSEDQCGWCGANDGMPSFVEEYLADSLINGILGWFLGEDGILADADFFSHEDETIKKRQQEEAAANHGEHHGKHHRGGGGRVAMHVFLWMVGLACAGAGGYAGFLAYKRWEELRRFGNPSGYAPMRDFHDADEFGDAVNLDSI